MEIFKEATLEVKKKHRIAGFILCLIGFTLEIIFISNSNHSATYIFGWLVGMGTIMWLWTT